MTKIDDQPVATIELTHPGEDHDWSGWVYCGDRKEQLLAECARDCWAHATEWLKQFGIALDQEYDVEEERGGYQYIDYGSDT